MSTFWVSGQMLSTSEERDGVSAVAEFWGRDGVRHVPELAPRSPVWHHYVSVGMAAKTN